MPVITVTRIFLRDEFPHPVLKTVSCRKRVPSNSPKRDGDLAHRHLKVLALQSDVAGLDGSLDQQSILTSTLRGPGDLSPVPHQVKLFSPDKTLTGHFH